LVGNGFQMNGEYQSVSKNVVPMTIKNNLKSVYRRYKLIKKSSWEKLLGNNLSILFVLGKVPISRGVVQNKFNMKTFSESEKNKKIRGRALSREGDVG
jgi:hypothetical protein